MNTLNFYTRFTLLLIRTNEAASKASTQLLLGETRREPPSTKAPSTQWLRREVLLLRCSKGKWIAVRTVIRAFLQIALESPQVLKLLKFSSFPPNSIGRIIRWDSRVRLWNQSKDFSRLSFGQLTSLKFKVPQLIQTQSTCSVCASMGFVRRRLNSKMLKRTRINAEMTLSWTGVYLKIAHLLLLQNNTIQAHSLFQIGCCSEWVSRNGETSFI